MKNLTLSLIFAIFGKSYSQKILFEFKYKEVKNIKGNFKWEKTELDSLILYEGGKFYRKELYVFHEVDISESTGMWNYVNDTLYLTSIKRKLETGDENTNQVVTFIVRKNKLIPYSIEDKLTSQKYFLSRKKKLKFIEK